MSIDGRFVKFLAEELDNELKNGRIQRIHQLAKTDFLFMVRSNNQNKKLYFSLSTSLARINITQKDYQGDYIPGGFCMFLRKHLEGGFLKKIRAVNDDRIIIMDIENKNEIGDLVNLQLVSEMFSKYTNMIVLDDKDIIINAFKHISPFDKAERTIVNSALYELPTDSRLFQDDLKGIQSLLNQDINYLDIVNNVRGISPLLAKYIVSEANHNFHRMFKVYLDIFNRQIKPTMFLGNKTDFYYIDIFNSKQKYFNSLSLLIDNFFDEASSIERVKQVYKYINTFVKQELKRKKYKIEKLYHDLDKANNNDILRIKGDILIANQHHIYKGDGKFTGFSYELNKEVEIVLDRLLNPIQNANKYYVKYKKLKTAVHHIEEQIKIAKNQVIYLDEILIQINNTHSLIDLLEIQDELKENGFLSRKKFIKKKKKPNYDTYLDNENMLFLVGKNNLQNNYLTHKYAKKDYWWFHAKEQTGSHVIVATTLDLKENTIRTAANLSAYFSKARLSSSVPIDYTRVRYLKKVPGVYGSFVTYTNQKTIYIDPDLKVIEKLKKGR